MKYFTLNGEWSLRQEGCEEVISATVPGSVACDFLRAGKIEDPFWRENESEATELFESDFEYTRSFDLTKEFLDADCVDLVLQGVDTLADIYINDKKLAHIDNMHRTWRFDVKNMLVEGKNNVKAYFYSPNKFIRKHHQEGEITYASNGNMNGTSYIRKAHCQFGWDWGPKIPDAGIWRSIDLCSYNIARIEETYITQVHTGSGVSLKCDIYVKPTDLKSFWSKDTRLEATVTVIAPGGETTTVVKQVSEGKNSFEIDIENAKLWWPNGYGEQPLYDVEFSLNHDGDELDTERYRIGLRTMTVSTEEDQWGSEFCIMVNGIKIFSMGADYIPEDSLFPRVTPERTRRILEDCVKANFNALRIWGGAYYPDNFFFDICDELGLIVWQDLMFACNVYNLTDAFAENIEHEVRDNMRRLRHHASLGLWCGNNEMEWGWTIWEDVIHHSPKFKADYIKMFEALLPRVAKETDPNTFYWLASPSSGGGFDEPNASLRGNQHYWDVWHGLKPFTDYRNHDLRFCSEFGFESFPPFKTIRSFAIEEDFNIFSPVMEAHQKLPGGNGKILHYISETYRYPKDFQSLIYISQILQMESIRYGVEHWRRHRGKCMGAIYWQLNDCWPVASWSSIDYFGRWKALHYGAKRFYAPIMATIFDEEKLMRFYVHNESMSDVTGVLKIYLKDKSFNILDSETIDVDIPKLSAGEALRKNYSDMVDSVSKKRSVFVECVLTVNGDEVSKAVTLFVAPKKFDFTKPAYEVNVQEGAKEYVVEIKADTFAQAVQVDVESEEIVFSNNYFDISSPDGVCIAVQKSELSDKIRNAEDLKKRVKLLSVADAY